MLPFVTVGMSGPTLTTLSLLTALHPDVGGVGQGSGATCIPPSINFLNFL